MQTAYKEIRRNEDHGTDKLSKPLRDIQKSGAARKVSEMLGAHRQAQYVRQKTV